MERRMQRFAQIMENISRRRASAPWFADTLLSPALGVRDLTWLGTAPVIGITIFIITGDVMRGIPGPLVIMGLFVATVCAAIAEFCYAEFGSRANACGSAYVYCYITLGEIFGFCIGWTLLLEHLLGAASVIKLCTQYMNILFNGTLYVAVQETSITWKVQGLGTFPDMFSPLLALVGGAIMCLGSKWTKRINLALCIITATSLFLILVSGIFSYKNWFKYSHSGRAKESTDYFAQQGIFFVASTVYYAFSSHEIVAIATEETSDSRNRVPRALLLSMAIGTLTTWGVCMIIIVMVPSRQLENGTDTLADAFAVMSFPVMRYVIILGGIAACFAALLALLFAITRLTYLLATEGLMFGCIARLTATTRVPVKATLIDAIIIGGVTMVISLQDLVTILSLGTLIAHNMVMISVILTRYQVGISSVNGEEYHQKNNQWLNRICCVAPRLESSDGSDDDCSHIDLQQENDHSPSPWQPSEKTSMRASVAMVAVLAGISGLCLTVTLSFPLLMNGDIWMIILTCVFTFVTVTSVVILVLQPRNNATFPVMVPWVPLSPLIGVLLNTLLIVALLCHSYWAFVRVVTWLVVGLITYGLYGYRYSTEALKPSTDTSPFMKLPHVPIIEQHVKHMQPSGSRDASDTEIVEEKSPQVSELSSK